MKPVKLGPMRQRVTLQSFTVSTWDSYGEEQKSWSDVGTYYAEVLTLSGREAVNAKQICAEATHLVRIRWIGPVDPSQQFLWGGRTLHILHVNNVDNRNREYQILCNEVVVPAS